MPVLTHSGMRLTKGRRFNSGHRKQ
jgi:hypothetical protein